MVEAQQWLESQEEYNNQTKREQIIVLNIKNKELTGELNLTDFVNLEALGCSQNQLTRI